MTGIIDFNYGNPGIEIRVLFVARLVVTGQVHTAGSDGKHSFASDGTFSWVVVSYLFVFTPTWADHAI